MTSLHHIGYWVGDLDSAMKQWRRDLGVGPFQVIEHVTFSEFVLAVGDQAYDDVVFDHAAAFAAWGRPSSNSTRSTPSTTAWRPRSTPPRARSATCPGWCPT